MSNIQGKIAEEKLANMEKEQYKNGLVDQILGSIYGQNRLAQSNMSPVGSAAEDAQFAELARRQGFVSQANQPQLSDAEYAAMNKMIADNRNMQAAKQAIDARNYVADEVDMSPGWAGTGPIDAIANKVDQYTIDNYNQTIDPSLAAQWRQFSK